ERIAAYAGADNVKKFQDLAEQGQGLATGVIGPNATRRRGTPWGFARNASPAQPSTAENPARVLEGHRVICHTAPRQRAWRARMADPGVKVKVEEPREGRIARVTVDNAKKLNCLSTPLIVELTAAFAKLRQDPALRAIVLTGAGERAFIGG